MLLRQACSHLRRSRSRRCPDRVPYCTALEQLAGEIDLGAVREMAAVIEAHAEDRVARLDQREVRRGVGLRARVRLHVGVVGAEQFLGAIDGELLGDVDELAAAVVALARIAFGVLVGEHRALRFEHARAGVVLRGDQLDVIFLALRARRRARPRARGRNRRWSSRCGTWRASRGRTVRGPRIVLDVLPGKAAARRLSVVSRRSPAYRRSACTTRGPGPGEVDAVVAAAARAEHAAVAQLVGQRAQLARRARMRVFA